LLRNNNLSTKIELVHGLRDPKLGTEHSRPPLPG